MIPFPARRLAALPILLAACALALPARGAPEDALKTCAECHGAEGVSPAAGTPHLAGQLAPYLADSLRAFRKGSRKTAAAQHTALDDGAIAALAEHYAALKTPRPKPPVAPETLARGERVYQDRCADCHVDNGRGSDKDAPLMAAQDADYLVAQTLAFKSGQRKFPFLMDDAYRDLSDADLAAAARYFAAQDQNAPATPGKKRKR